MEHRLQTLIGHMLKMLQVKRQRRNVGTERRAQGGFGNSGFRLGAAMRASANQTAVTLGHRRDGWKINRIVFADHRAQCIHREHMTAIPAAIRAMIHCLVGILT